MLGLILLLVGIAVILIVLAKLTTKKFEYKCPKCGETFSLSTVQELFTFEIMGFSPVRCPKCKRWSVSPIRVKQK
ncbi:hypothetical protein A374_06556 [Fictibacillus macauensis ZFHKF-1]|uniref:Uncharacterized protein n=1 Tax=Fictibacillus macauensis ZFHKF-1 TaxID=1196324 RepID=I8AKW6_9BACL|nr:hypothetical protein [Fictibacillus macauensis]EIT86239.1 hypothetical protein A374_06556 [Fictibacillus macauensis ZFHKF-1]